MKTLNIIQSAYRGTIEEQDDTVVWITHALRGAGAPIDVLLRGAAVNYAVEGQEVAPMMFGDRAQSHAPDVLGETARLLEKGATVYVLKDDVQRRGIDPAKLIDGVRPVWAASLPKIFIEYDNIWHW